MYSYKDDIASESLWELYLSGDALALDMLVKRHYNLLYVYGCKFTYDNNLVKDCIQDLFLYLWRKRTSVTYTSSVKHYLMKALRRRLQRALTRSSFPLLKAPAAIAFLDEDAVRGDNKLIGSELAAELDGVIQKAMAQLSRRQREVIYLRFYLNAEPGEIADIMQISRQSVYNLLHGALQALRLAGETYFQRPISFPVWWLLSLAAASLL